MDRSTCALVMVLGVGFAGCGPTASASDAGGDDTPGASDAGPPPACANIEADAELVRRPIDIIIVIDTSATMGPAVAQVESTINNAFTSVIEAAGIDYRVILLSSGVTIGPPLSTNGRLSSYDVATGSGNAYAVVGGSYATWAPSLRAGALKAFLWFTDSSSGEGPGQGAAFDGALLGMDPTQFGTPAARNYLLHSIIGIAANNPPTAPWLPADPLLGSTCTTGGFPTGPGEGFQELSILTGGLRFPICEFAFFDSVFQTLAGAVITGAAVPCSFDLPTPPAGETLDLSSIVLQYTSGTMATETFTQVAGAAQCTDGAFYVEATQIHLCPATCSRVTADDGAEIDIRFDCEPVVD